FTVFRRIICRSASLAPEAGAEVTSAEENPHGPDRVEAAVPRACPDRGPAASVARQWVRCGCLWVAGPRPDQRNLCNNLLPRAAVRPGAGAGGVPGGQGGARVVFPGARTSLHVRQVVERPGGRGGRHDWLTGRVGRLHRLAR